MSPSTTSTNPFHPPPCDRRSYPVLDPVSQAYPRVKGRLLTYYSPVRHSSTQCKHQASAFDLHVLSTPPAFVLSQDQTLRQKTIQQKTTPTPPHRQHEKGGIPADTQHPQETGKHPRVVRPSTKNKKLWYQQTRHTIELTNNKPHHTTPHQGHNGRLRSASLAAGDPGCNSR